MPHELKRKKIGIELRKNSIRISGEGVDKEYIIDKEQDYDKQVSLAIKDFSKLIKATFLSINFSITYDSEVCINQSLIMPDMEDKLLDKSILHEIESSIDKRIDDYENRWIKNDFGSIYSFLLKKKEIERLSTFNSIYWKVEKIEPQIITFWNLVEDDSVVIDVRKDRIVFYFYKDIPGLAKEVVMENEFNLEDFSSLVLAEVREIEIDSGVPIDSVYLIGDFMHFEEVRQHISNELKIETKELGSSYVYSSTVIENNKKIMNFVTNKKKSEYISPVLSVVIVSLLIANMGLFMIKGKYEKVDKVVKDSQMQVENNLSELSGQLSRIDSDIEMFQKDIRMVDGIKDSKVWLSKILYTLSEETPSGIAVNDLYIDKNKTRIKGYSKDYTNIGFFSIALEKYGEVDIEEIDLYNEDVTIGGGIATKEFSMEFRGSGSFE